MDRILPLLSTCNFWVPQEVSLFEDNHCILSVEVEEGLAFHVLSAALILLEADWGN